MRKDKPTGVMLVGFFLRLVCENVGPSFYFSPATFSRFFRRKGSSSDTWTRRSAQPTWGQTPSSVRRSAAPQLPPTPDERRKCWSRLEIVILKKVRRQPSKVKDLLLISNYRATKSPSQNRHQLTIGTFRRNFHWRISPRPRQVQCHSYKHGRDRKIRPRIQTPLPSPRQRPRRRNGARYAIGH
jgi:hypothetical protein